MTSDSHQLSRAIPILDAFIWYSYLLILIAVSFLNGFYSSKIWLFVSACIYCLCVLCAFSAINGGRCNWRGLIAAKYMLVLLAAMLVLLLLQMAIPISYPMEHLLFSNSLFDGTPPEWFQPNARWSIVPHKTRWLFTSEILIFSIFTLSIVLLVSRRRLKQLLFVFLLVGLTHALIGIFAKYGQLSLVDTKQLDGHFSAARAWFINRNHFAAFVSLCLVGALAYQLKNLASQTRRSFRSLFINQLLSFKSVYLLGLIVGLVGLVLSQSRAGFLSLLVSMFLVFLSVGKTTLANTIKLQRRSVLLPIGVIVTTILVYFGGELLTRFSSDSLLGERTAQWSLTWQAIKPVWLIGYGGNSYADVFQTVRGYEDFRQVLFNQAHNDYLHIWLEQGLLGLSLWLGLLMLAIRNAYIGIANTTSTLVSATLISSLVVIFAALAQSLVDFNLQILNIRYYFFVIISLLFSVPTIRQRKGTPENSVLV